MTRPNASALELDGNEIKIRLQAKRFETTSHVHVDWLRFTVARRFVLPELDLLFPPAGQVRDANIWAENETKLLRQLKALQDEQDQSAAMQALTLANDVVERLGSDFQVNPKPDKGHDFYGKRWKIELRGKEVGWVGYGVSSDSPKQRAQAETVHCNLYGAACTFADSGWTARMAALIDEYSATITRCDLALDFFDGLPPEFSISALHTQLMHGDFKVRGKEPKWHVFGVFATEERSHSRSIYIGSKEAGKQTNVYEKGHQLFGPESKNPWVRIELRYGNKLRVLPSDILRRPAQFFAGASKHHEHWLELAEQHVIAVPVPCEKRLPVETCDAEVTRNLMWAVRTAGPTLSAALRYLGDTQLFELARVDAPVLPARLHGFSHDQLQASFSRVGVRLFGALQ